eukprot:m.659587 g.659587  ORF g.659587 m.659587 type:complete len:622 (-) comp58443_c0_seq64:215-2080(-)
MGETKRTAALSAQAVSATAAGTIPHIRDAPGTQSKWLYEEQHHVVIEIVKHTISPLSIAMFVWFAGKYGLIPNYQAWFRARSILKAAQAAKAQQAAKQAAAAAAASRPAQPLFTQGTSAARHAHALTATSHHRNQHQISSTREFSTLAAQHRALRVACVHANTLGAPLVVRNLSALLASSSTAPQKNFGSQSVHTLPSLIPALHISSSSMPGAASNRCDLDQLLDAIPRSVRVSLESLTSNKAGSSRTKSSFPSFRSSLPFLGAGKQLPLARSPLQGSVRHLSASAALFSAASPLPASIADAVPAAKLSPDLVAVSASDAALESSSTSVSDTIQTLTASTSCALTDAVTAISAAAPADPLPFHNVERLLGVYDPAVVDSVLHHAVDVWSVVQIEQLILKLHEVSGLPWWSTICLATIGLRCVTVPFVTLLLKHNSKAKIAKARLGYLLERMESPGADDAEKIACAEEVMQIYKEKKLKVVGDWIIPLGFPPLMLSFFGATYNLSMQEGSMVNGGTLWFPDLMATDTTYFLPVLSCLTWLGVTEMAGGNLYASNGKLRLWLRMASIAFIPVTGGVPCGVLMFWITSNCWEMARVWVSSHDAVRRALGIPLVSEVPRPPVGIW